MIISTLVVLSLALVIGFALPDGSDFAALEGNLCSEIVLQNTTSDDYLEANQLDNEYYNDILSLAIIFCSCENDVIESINFIKYQQQIDPNLEFRVRSGGHSYGGYSKCSNCIIIDTSGLNSITYDSDKEVIIAGPGVLGQQLLDKLLEWNSSPNNFNILLPIPASPTVALGGYTLGGGVTFDSRGIGLMADYLIGAKIVLENGELIEVMDNDNVNSLNNDNNDDSSDESNDESSDNDKNRKKKSNNSDKDHKKILYALRGGGITVGIVVEYIFKPEFLNDNPTTTFGVLDTTISVPISFADGGASAKSFYRAYRNVVYCVPDTNGHGSGNDECIIFNKREYSTSVSVFFNFVSFSYEVTVGVVYYGNEYDSGMPLDFIENTFLPALQNEMDVNYTLSISQDEPTDYITYITNNVINTATVAGLGAATIIPTRLIFNAKESFTDNFISNFIDFHLYVAFNQFFQSGLLFVTINQNWINSYFSENYKLKSKISYYPNRDAHANFETLIIGFKSSYPTKDSIINELKPILDIYGSQLNNIFSELSDQRYLNYISIFETSYLDNFGRQDESKTNEKIVRRIQKLKKKYDKNDFFGFELSIPVE